MSNRDSQSPLPSLPSSRQILLATCTGVAIGLALTNFYKHQPLAGAGRSDRARTQLAAQLTSQQANGATVQANGAALTAQSSKGLLDFSDFHLWPKLDQRMNVLLMGVDSNGRDTERFTGCRSDTMMIASLDPKSHKVSLVSLPRDSRVRIAGNHGVDKINAAHALGGPELAVQTVCEDFAVPVDHYIVIDVQGLKKVFEVLGPVDVLVEKSMHYRDRAGRLDIALEPGVVSMDPTQLEEYVRYRHDAKGDIGRIERQQWFMRQVKKKLEEPQVLLKLPDLFKLAGEYVRTDLTVEEMAKLASFSKDIKPGEIETAMLPGVGATISGGSYWLPDAPSAALVLHRLLGAPLAASTIANNTGSTIKPLPSHDPGSAEAAALAPPSSTNDDLNQALAAANSDKPLSVIVHYPRGGEALAKTLEARLAAKGMTVRNRQRGDAAECAHEQIVATSYRADDVMTAKLKGAVGELSPFAVSLNLDARAASDFIVVLSPNSTIAAPDPSPNSPSAQDSASQGSTADNKGAAPVSR